MPFVGTHGPAVRWSTVLIIALAVVAGAPRTADAGFSEPWFGVSSTSGGISQRGGEGSSLAIVNGVPYVAGREWDGTNFEVRVARLSGRRWRQPWEGISRTSGGINQSTEKQASAPHLTAVNGVPYVAWYEFGMKLGFDYGALDPDDPTNALRVARLNGRRWEQPWEGVSASSGGITPTRNGTGGKSLTSVRGVPYLAWTESGQLRVARLNGRLWEQPWLGVTDTQGGIQSTDRATHETSIAAVGGVPYVAWRQGGIPRRNGNVADYVRVARLDGRRWRQPWNGVSDSHGGINRPATDSISEPNLASVGGVPYVTWIQSPLNFGTSGLTAVELRVARLNHRNWEQPWRGTRDYGGIDRSAGLPHEPDLANVGGVAHIAWSATVDSTNGQVRLARLAGSRWKRLGPGSRQMSHRMTRCGLSRFSPQLAGVAGVAYVAWIGKSGQVRVARGNGARRRGGAFVRNRCK